MKLKKLLSKIEPKQDNKTKGINLITIITMIWIKETKNKEVLTSPLKNCRHCFKKFNAWWVVLLVSKNQRLYMTKSQDLIIMNSQGFHNDRSREIFMMTGLCFHDNSSRLSWWQVKIFMVTGNVNNHLEKNNIF